MKAIILAAGVARRLAPLTDHTHKCLLPVDGRSLLDRMLVLRMPEPGAEHLEALLPSLCLAMAREQGLDARFVPPMTAAEIADVRRHWAGGSVRRLRQVVEVVLGARDRFEMKH